MKLTFLLPATIGLVTALPPSDARLTNTLDPRQTCNIKLTPCNLECKKLTEELNRCLCDNNRGGGSHWCNAMENKLVS